MNAEKPDNIQDAEAEAQALAFQDEQAAAQQASIAYLQQRAVMLNMEVRRRDGRIAELEAELAAARQSAAAEAEAAKPTAEEPGADSDTP